MKISREWLQEYFESPLPDAAKLAEALTFHAFEIESIENEVLDVKVTPNRGHDCLSHRGIAKELSAILNTPLSKDPFRDGRRTSIMTPATTMVSVTIESAESCSRYAAAYVTGVKVGPSPAWLVKRLESIGQRSINNIVDATNYVMFDLGQPLHAFDAKRLTERSIVVRTAQHGETMTGLDNREYTFTSEMLLITSGGTPVGIAGVKGGKNSQVDESTTDLVIEAAHFDGVSVRKTSRALNLRTDASARFEQGIAPEIAGYGLQSVVELILKIAGGDLQGYTDVFNSPTPKRTISFSVESVNNLLGTSLKGNDIEDVFSRLGFLYKGLRNPYVGFEVEIPFERLDLQIPEDIIEEIGRIAGYETVREYELPLTTTPQVNARFASAEKIRDDFVRERYSEVITSVFADKGERAVSNKIGGDKPFLRATLLDGLKDAYERNLRNKDLLMLSEVKLFEIGTVWKKGKETIMVGTIDKTGAREIDLSESEMSYTHDAEAPNVRYESFSKYPFIVRDVAFWIEGSDDAGIEDLIRAYAGDLLVRLYRFDRFEKAGKTSLAYRLVFQSPDRTLFDDDANRRMESVYSALKLKGYEIR